MARPFSPTATHVRIEGSDELRQWLLTVPKKVGNKILRQALRRAGKIVQERAKALAPVESGLLKKSISVRRSKRAKRGTEAVVIFPDVTKFAVAEKAFGVKVGETAVDFYAPYQEFGTHDMPAHPYMRPAFDQTKDKALAIVKGDVLKGVSAERVKSARSAA